MNRVVAYFRPFASELRLALRPSFSLAIVSLVLMHAGGAAEASISIIDGAGMGNPAENLVFNKAGLVLGGITVQGATNGTSVVLDIMSTDGVTLAASGGAASVSETAGDPFEGVMFIPHAVNDLPAGLNPFAGFSDFKFNVDATEDGTIDIDVLDDMGMTTSASMLSINGNGNNFFRIQADMGDYITKVTITTAGTMMMNPIIDSIKQIRLGGLIDPTGAPIPTVPEPYTLAIWSFFGLIGGGAIWRRRRREDGATA